MKDAVATLINYVLCQLVSDTLLLYDHAAINGSSIGRYARLSITRHYCMVLFFYATSFRFLVCLPANIVQSV